MTKEENRKRTAEEIADIIRNSRKALGWSLYKLSKETGITEGHLSKIESGEIVMRVDMLQRITEALHVYVSFPLR
jgi:transcriptional regulator with XRE-family HTH domain